MSGHSGRTDPGQIIAPEPLVAMTAFDGKRFSRTVDGGIDQKMTTAVNNRVSPTRRRRWQSANPVRRPRLAVRHDFAKVCQVKTGQLETAQRESGQRERTGAATANESTADAGEWRFYYFGARAMLRDQLATRPGATAVSDPTAAEMIIIDLHALDQESLLAALNGLDRTSSVPRVIISVRGVDDPEVSGYAAEVAAAERAAIPDHGDWCVLRCTPLGQGLAQHLRFTAEYGALCGCYDPAGVSWLDAADLADLVAVLAREPSHRHGAYDVSGPSVLPMKNLVDDLSDHLATQVEYLQLDEPAYRTILTDAGMPPAAARRLTEIQVLSSQVRQRTPTSVLAGALGRPSRPLPEYLAEVVAAIPPAPRNE